jgi:hypothetical protein
MKQTQRWQRNVLQRPGLRSLDTSCASAACAWGVGTGSWKASGHLHPATVKKRLNQPRGSKQSPYGSAVSTWLEPVTAPIVIARRGSLDNN